MLVAKVTLAGEIERSGVVPVDGVGALGAKPVSGAFAHPAITRQSNKALANRLALEIIKLRTTGPRIMDAINDSYKIQNFIVI